MYSPWQSKLKLNYMKNPSFVELCSLCQINQVCKEENQRRNLTSNNFAWLCEIFSSLLNAKRNTSCRTESKTLENEFHILCEISQALRNQNWGKSISHPVRNFASIAKSSCVIFRYFCTDSFRFLSQDILCNYLFSHCNQLKIFLDI